MKILLVEDDAALLLGIRYALEKEGFSVTEAPTFEIAKNTYLYELDLVLLDITLPDGNGYDLCKLMRKKSDVPIIFMTAMDDEANVVFGLDIGGDDYITKPVRISELISRINAVLRRRKKETSINKSKMRLVSGSILIEPLQCRVSLKGEEVNLTAAEYKLLLMLIENKGNVLERNTIIEKLWDIDGSFIDGNTLNVYIKRLREKIETEDEKHIETIRGIGYVWREQAGNS